MAVDMFIWFDNSHLKGETKDDVYSKKNAIDVLAWSWGMSQSGTFHTGGGGGAGKASFQDLSITKWVDKASPVLQLFCATGEHIKEATLVVRKAGSTPLEYILLKMTELMVTSVSTGGSGGEDRLTENVTLNFAKVEFKYVEQKPDGTAGDKPEFKYDIEANKKL